MADPIEKIKEATLGVITAMTEAGLARARHEAALKTGTTNPEEMFGIARARREADAHAANCVEQCVALVAKHSEAIEARYGHDGEAAGQGIATGTG